MATWLEEATGFFGVDTALRDLGAWVVAALPGGEKGAAAQGLVSRAGEIVKAEQAGESTALATLELWGGSTALGAVGAASATGEAVKEALSGRTLILLLLAGAAALWVLSR